ncbi:hypothetical protein C8046_07705 [Serinibacter arcticus]|uniref:ATP-grasp domain-containing protein n=1 Tax=Serinibacter arcticus TaxID=1655435 RepID=A0A2U1ZU96_9MICO|nr:ATP-grasp domain-containing protein [Serinibacter arcticus]PWD50554.1 hypothetical protein C8046_07705 [Serinibacter arcticus]
MTEPLLLIPSDVLNPRRPDEHFAAETLAAREAGLAVALVDHDALARPDGELDGVRTVPANVADTPRRAVYRGWMLTSDRYAATAAALADRGVILVTSPVAFARAHELPGWYDAIREHTPASEWTVGPGREAFEAAARRLGPGPAVLRDWTKSMKHHWVEAAYVPDAADADAAWNVASRFLELRDDAFVGGLVLRRFEELEPDEVRTWWAHGRCVTTGAHPDTPQVDRSAEAAAAVAALAPTVAALGLPFVTVDLARRSDGVWRVVEIGDGQVSDRPTSLAPEAMLDVVRAVLAGA